MSQVPAISGGWGARYHLVPHDTQVCGCRPPHVPVPKPGPCPKHKLGDAEKAIKKAAKKAAPKKAAKSAEKVAAPKKAAKKAAAKTAKAVAKPRAAKTPAAQASGGYVQGHDLTDNFDYRHLAQLSRQGGGSDPALAEIARLQGFDGPPQILDDAGLENLVAAGGVRLWRGVESSGGRSAADYAHDYRTGPAHYGHGGARGNGIYFGTESEVADHYSNGSLAGQVYAVLKPDAKVIDWEDAKANVSKQVHDANVHGNKLVQALKAATRAGGRGKDPEQAYKQAYDTYRTWNDNKDVRHQVLGDVGRLAAVQGYDAIRITNTGRPWGPYYIVLNRTATATEDIPAPRPAPAARTASAAPVHADSIGARVDSVLAHLAAAARRRAADRPAGPAASAVSCCLEPGEHHPGPCPKNTGLLRRLIGRGSAHPRAAPKSAVPAGHQRATGKDLLSTLDMDTIGKLRKREGGNMHWRGGQYDAQLAAIAAQQGFDGPPQIVGRDEFDKLKAASGAIPLYRGTEHNFDTVQSGDEVAAAFRHGPIHYGQGFSGNGIYTSSSRDEALGYTSDRHPGSLNEMVLSPSARTIGYRDVQRQMDRDMPADTRERLEAVSATQQLAFKPGARAGDMIVQAQAMRDKLQPQDWLWMDPSAYAMARGYDAIYHGKQERFPTGEWVLLNRTAVATLAPDAPPRSLQEIYPDEQFSTGVKVRIYIGEQELTGLLARPIALSARTAPGAGPFQTPPHTPARREALTLTPGLPLASPQDGHRYLTIAGTQVAICGCLETHKPGPCKGQKKGQKRQQAPAPGTPPGYPPVLNEHVAKKTAVAVPPGKNVKVAPMRKGGAPGRSASRGKPPRPAQPSTVSK